VAKDRLCRACFDGVYPVELPDEAKLGKHVLEGFGIAHDELAAIDEVVRRP